MNSSMVTWSGELTSLKTHGVQLRRPCQTDNSCMRLHRYQLPAQSTNTNSSYRGMWLDPQSTLLTSLYVKEKIPCGGGQAGLHKPGLSKSLNPTLSYSWWGGGLQGDLPGRTFKDGITGMAMQRGPRYMLPPLGWLTVLRPKGKILDSYQDETIGTLTEGHFKGGSTEQTDHDGLWSSRRMYPLKPLVQFGQLSLPRGLIRAHLQLLAHLR